MTLPILKRSANRGRVIGIELLPKEAIYVDARQVSGGIRILDVQKTTLEGVPKLLEKVKESVRVRISGHFANSIHQILKLPSAKKKVMNSLATLELEKTLGRTASTAWIELQERDTLTAGKRVMAVGVDEQVVGNISKLLRSFRGAPHTLLTYPVAIHALLSAQGLLDDKPCAFVEVFEKEIHIIVFEREEVRLVRDLPFGTSSFPKEISKLVQSIFQTVLFHKQSFSGQDIERIIVVAKGFESEICESIKSELGKEAVDLDLSKFIVNEEETEIPPASCIGLLLLTHDRHPLRLVTRAVRTQNTLQRNLMVAGSVSLILAGIFGFSYHKLQTRIDSLSDTNNSLRVEIKFREDRIGNAKQGLIIHTVEHGQPDWESIFREFAFVIPEQVMLHSMKINSANGVWKGEATGEVQIDDKNLALLQMSELLQRLKMSPIFATHSIERSLVDERIRFVLKFNLDLEPEGVS